jgi:hypothetical protein
VKRERPQQPPAGWRTRRTMQLYVAGEPVVRIAGLVGWSEGRVRKVLREAGLAVPEADEAAGDLESGNHEEGRRRLLVAGWESKLRGGIVVWHRPDGRGSWYTEDGAIEILEAMEGDGGTAE